jgi:hypothetical protein
MSKTVPQLNDAVEHLVGPAAEIAGHESLEKSGKRNSIL